MIVTNTSESGVFLVCLARENKDYCKIMNSRPKHLIKKKKFYKIEVLNTASPTVSKKHRAIQSRR
jgi:hypothetical protein